MAQLPPYKSPANMFLELYDPILQKMKSYIAYGVYYGHNSDDLKHQAEVMMWFREWWDRDTPEEYQYDQFVPATHQREAIEEGCPF